MNGKPLDVLDELQTKEFYFEKLTERPINKDRIYECQPPAVPDLCTRELI